MNKINFIKHYKDLYAPGTEPALIEVPSMQFIMIEGHGNPNDTDGEYQKAVELLYSLSYTIKMNCIDYSDTSAFEYSVPPQPENRRTILRHPIL